MNGRTRRSSVAGNNSSSTKKRKSIKENNIRQSTECSKTTSDIIENISMNGKTTDKDEYETNSDTSSYDDSSSGSDDDQDNDKNKPRKKRRSKYDSMHYLVRLMRDLKNIVYEERDRNIRVEEKVNRMEDKMNKMEEERKRVISVVTVDGRKTISDLTPHSSDIDGYFKREKKFIDDKIRKTIYDHTFAKMKFLYEPTRRDDDEEQPPTPTEMVVLKAIEVKLINVPTVSYTHLTLPTILLV